MKPRGQCNSSRRRLRAAGWAALVLCSGLAAGRGAAAGGEVIATWTEGEVTKEEYSAWAEYLGDEGEPDQAALERYVLTLWLADQPEARRVATTGAFAARERLLGERRLVEALRRSEFAAVVISEEDLDARRLVGRGQP